MIDPIIFKFPLSLILTAAVLSCIIVFRNSRPAKLLTSRAFSVTLIVLAVVSTAVEGTWGLGIPRHWAFLAIILTLLFSLGFNVLADWKRKSCCSLFSHLGLFLILLGGFLGAADRTDAQLKLFPGCEERLAFDTGGNAVLLPFSISLDEFSIDYYEDGTSPRQYSSRLTIDGKEYDVSVNHPCRYKGYRFYQSGYDAEYGRYSVLKIVRDPWLPVSLIGVLLLAAAILMNLKSTWGSWKALAAAIILAAVFTLVSVAKISFSTLMPALRSLWFVPHLIIYMLAYAILAISVITGIVTLFSEKIPSGLPSRLLATSSSLLLAGMICGAVWAQQAWGSYWTWDTKECWAAATWLLSLAGTHLPGSGRKNRLLFTVLAFIAMQMTWYGVNFLPSSGQSLHTYNQTEAK